MAAAALEPAATALATDGMPAAASPATNTPGTDVSPIGPAATASAAIGVGGARARPSWSARSSRRWRTAGTSSPPHSRSLPSVNTTWVSLAAAVAADGADLALVDVDAGVTEPAAVVVGES